MQSIEFEVATFADAIRKAASIAPTKGSSLDAFWGVVLTCDSAGKCSAMSANPDVTYKHDLTPTKFDLSGEDSVWWRVPANIIDSMASGLPLVLGGKVALTRNEKDGVLDAFICWESGTYRGKFRFSHEADRYLAPESFDFDPNGLGEADAVAEVLGRIAWATNKKGGATRGVHLNGTHIYATNSVVMMKMALPFPTTKPVTVPFYTVAPLIKNYPTISVGGDEKLLIRTDPDTWITIGTIAEEYPSAGLERLIAVASAYPATVELDRVRFLDVLARVESIFENSSRATITINPGTIKISAESPDGEMVEDEVPAADDADPFEVEVSASDIKSIMASFAGQTVTFKHGAHPIKDLLFFTDATGLQVGTLPRKPSR